MCRSPNHNHFTSSTPTLWFSLLISGMLLVACSGGGGGGGTSPTAPVTPAPVTAAAVVPANIVHTGTLTLTSCSVEDCRYRLKLKNEGKGCANNVRGRIEVFKTQGGSVLESDDWQLPPMKVIRPGHGYVVEDECCISTDTAIIARYYTWETFWTNTTC